MNAKNKFLSNHSWTEVKSLKQFRSTAWTDYLVSGMPISGPGAKGGPTQQELVGILKDAYPVALARLWRAQKRLNELFIAKEEIIKMVFVSAIAGQPMLLVGPPGTAKSKILTRFCELLGISRSGEGTADEGGKHTCFEYLLHSFTEPDEILGVVNINALRGDKDAGEEAKFVRFHAGSITEAEVIFLDEVFRANSSILNALLTIINERRIYEGGEPISVPAKIIFGASNAPPSHRQLEELRAFYSRFVIRMESNLIPLEYSIKDPERIPDNRSELLRRGWGAEVSNLRVGHDPVHAAEPAITCLNDILLCNRAVTELWGGENLDDPMIQPFVLDYHKAVISLGGNQNPHCIIDDRKFIRLFLVARAHALFVHNGPPRCEDLIVLAHIWEDLNDREPLTREVVQLTRLDISANAPQIASNPDNHDEEEEEENA